MRVRPDCCVIIESLPVSVFWKDRKLRYLGCNTRFARDAGLRSPAQLIGKSAAEMEEIRKYRGIKSDATVVDACIAILSEHDLADIVSVPMGARTGSAES